MAASEWAKAQGLQPGAGQAPIGELAPAARKTGLRASLSGAIGPWLPTIGGMAGGAIGAAAGTPADILTGPLGTTVGAMTGAGLGGAMGKSAQQMLAGAP